MREKRPAFQKQLNGQDAWIHDEGWDYGPMHTFDGLRVNGKDDRPRKVHVLVPHDLGSGRRHPVLYMNDGQTAFFPGGPGPDSWRVAETVGELVAAKRIEPIIVVAVHPVDRDREYTHAPWFPNKGWGGLPGYADYLAGPVKSWIDATYPTRPDRASTAVAGSSHGGLAAFYTACRHADRIGFAGALSPSFWVGSRSPREVTKPLAESQLVTLTRDVLSDRARRPRLWIDWGMRGDGAQRGARDMAALVEKSFGYEQGKDLFVVDDAEGSHDEKSWARRFRGMLEFAFPAR